MNSRVISRLIHGPSNSGELRVPKNSSFFERRWTATWGPCQKNAQGQSRFWTHLQIVCQTEGDQTYRSGEDRIALGDRLGRRTANSERGRERSDQCRLLWALLECQGGTEENEWQGCAGFHITHATCDMYACYLCVFHACAHTCLSHNWSFLGSVVCEPFTHPCFPTKFCI